MAARPNPAAGTGPAPAILRVSFRLLNNVGADAHIGPLIRPQIDRGRVWAPRPYGSAMTASPRKIWGRRFYAFLGGWSHRPKR